MNKWLKIGIVLLFVAAIGYGGYQGISRNKRVKEANAKAVVSFADMNKETLGSYNLTKDPQVQNVLLIGSDKRGTETGYGRSDCMVIATVDKKNNQLKMTSLLGDCYVEIPGYGKNTLSMAYSIGGVSLLYQTIASNFGVQLDNYAIMEFSAFVKAIDKIGGVTVEVSEKDAAYLREHYSSTAGEVLGGPNILNGTQTLAYVRIKQDAARDFGRVQRQRAVMKAASQQLTGTSVSKLVPIMNELLDSVETDMNADVAKEYLASVIAMSSGDIREKTIPTDDAYTAKVKKGRTIYSLDLDKCKETMADFIYNPVEKQDTSEETQAEE